MSSSQDIDENYIQLGHIACIINSCQLDEAKVFEIKAIIDKNFDVNYKLPNSFICQNKPHLSGYTALHFAADRKPFHSSACFNLLMEHGADFTVENDLGYSPLLLLLKNDSIAKDDSLLFSHLTKNNMKKSCKYGITFFHVACLMNNFDVVNLFLKDGASANEHIHHDSPQYAGYTPLHFAAQRKGFQTIELLLKNGANMNCKDAKGISPLHLLVKNLVKFGLFDNLKFLYQLSKILSLIHLPDNVGLTYLHISCMTNDVSLINSFINQDVNIDSPIRFDSPFWPGYTPLHVASNFEFDTVLFLLEKGANLLVKDASGTTPFDLCIKKYNLDQIIKILSMEKRHNLSQIKLTDGTLLLDVLRAMKNHYGFSQFIKDKIMNVNIFIPFNTIIWPGWNLLHLVTLNRDLYSLADPLLSCNVDFTMLNANGASPLHLFFDSRFSDSNVVKNILDCHDRIPVNPVDQDNLSHLHIACAMQNRYAVEILLNNGADPNLPILHDSRPYGFHRGSTPFHLAAYCIDADLLKKFLSYGANIYAAKANGVTPFEAIYINSSINAQLVHRNLEINFEQLLESVPEILITIRMALDILNIAVKKHYLLEHQTEIIKIFLKKQIYEELGFTRLQIACVLDDMTMVKEELESGADVNQQITYVSGLWPSNPDLYQFYRNIFCLGDTALHIHCRKDLENLEIAEILLAHGADINLKNEHNLTPVNLTGNNDVIEILLSNQKYPIENPVNNCGLSHFHLCCQLKNLDLVEEYLKAGVNVNATVSYFADNYVAGYSPLHFAVQYRSMEVFELLLKYGADLNIKAGNGLTPMLMVFNLNYVSIDQMKSLLRSSIDIQIIRSFKETVLESIFENYNYPYVEKKKIEWIIQSGCELNKKDNAGNTILHKANCCGAVRLLLSLGADVNIKNDKGQTPYVYKMNGSFPGLKKVFIEHIRKLQLAGLFVDQSNEIDYNEDRDNYEIYKIEEEKCQLDVELKKKVNLSFDVRYFYSEQFIVNYKRMPAVQRQDIRNFCESDDLQRYFPRTCDLIKLQFRKARSRIRLLEPAAAALQSLADLAIPELCLESIFHHLNNNDDLMNLIRAEFGSLIFAPLADNSKSLF